MVKPRIGITIGDPAGIGPEIVKKAVNSLEIRKICMPVVIGYAGLISGERPSIRRAQAEFVDVRCGNISAVRPGKYSAFTGLASFKFLERSIELLKQKKIDAVVTAPISKEALKLAGIKYSGHTELFADYTGTKDFAMLMAAGPLRAVMVTRHMPLSDVAKSITSRNIVSAALLTRRFLIERFKIRAPRLAVCALNPHAGENGLLGKEEGLIISPAVKQLIKKKALAVGPLPADSAWLKLKRGEFDLLVGMYHDQVMIPLKTLSPEKIVNITVGLPFIRTSPGHGTGFDIAGKNIADPSSMIEAIKTAVELACTGKN